MCTVISQGYHKAKKKDNVVLFFDKATVCNPFAFYFNLRACSPHSQLLSAKSSLSDKQTMISLPSTIWVFSTEWW